MKINKKELDCNDENLIGINTSYIGKYLTTDLVDINTAAAKRIKILSNTQPSSAFSNQLGWQSHRKFMEEECMKGILPFIGECILDYINKTMVMSKFNSLNIISLWANVCPKYSYHRKHTHPDAIVSGAYYIQIPEPAARIIFTNPQHLFKNTLWSRKLGLPYYSIAPKEGMCLIFDSTTEHEVESNMAEDARISVSFNCQIN